MTTRLTHRRTGKKVLPSQRNHRVSTHLLCPSISLCVIFRSEKRFYSNVSCENYRSGFYGVLLFSYLAGYRQRIRSLPSVLQEIWRLFHPLATSRSFLGQGIRADISKHSIQRSCVRPCILPSIVAFVVFVIELWEFLTKWSCTILRNHNSMRF